MKQPEALAALVGMVGGAVILIHDYAYRRADNGEGDYELGGLLTHAGVDMVILSMFVAAAVWAWAKWGPL